MFEVSSLIGSLSSLPRQAAGGVVLVAVIAGLAGCQGQGPINGAVDLYHGLQGGAIAEQRPPPPGADSPYPKLATMPSRPPAPDVAAEQRIADQLATQRDAAKMAAAQTPLIPFAAPAPPPKPAPAAPPDPNGNRIVVDAAASPAAPPAKPVVPPPAPSAIDAVPAVPASVTSGPLPSFAAAPPAPASGLGVLTPPVAPPSLAPTSPVPPATAAAPAAVGTVVAIVFTPGSSTLPPSATLNLRRFALAHKGVPLNVTGQGDAVLLSPDAQARALDLALHRAQAIAASLAQAGVPAVNLRLHAQASGPGGFASL